jgi:hypothetical protein
VLHEYNAKRKSISCAYSQKTYDVEKALQCFDEPIADPLHLARRPARHLLSSDVKPETFILIAKTALEHIREVAHAIRPADLDTFRLYLKSRCLDVNRDFICTCLRGLSCQYNETNGSDSGIASQNSIACYMKKRGLQRIPEENGIECVTVSRSASYVPNEIDAFLASVHRVARHVDVLAYEVAQHTGRDHALFEALLEHEEREEARNNHEREYDHERRKCVGAQHPRQKQNDGNERAATDEQRALRQRRIRPQQIVAPDQQAGVRREHQQLQDELGARRQRQTDSIEHVGQRSLHRTQHRRTARRPKQCGKLRFDHPPNVWESDVRERIGRETERKKMRNYQVYARTNTVMPPTINSAPIIRNACFLYSASNFACDLMLLM